MPPLDEEVRRRKGLGPRSRGGRVVTRRDDQLTGGKTREQPADHLGFAEVGQIFAHERRIAARSTRANACPGGHSTAIIALWQPTEGL